MKRQGGERVGRCEKAKGDNEARRQRETTPRGGYQRPRCAWQKRGYVPRKIRNEVHVIKRWRRMCIVVW
jgi:hypothetical protein